MVNVVSQEIIRSWIKRATRQLGFSSPILWMYLPISEQLVGKLNESFVLFHCVDEYSAVPWGRRSLIVEQEKSLLKKADLTVTCSMAVFDRKATWAREIINVPHGVDYEHYSKAADDSTAIAPELKMLNGPVAGFVGAIDDRIDEKFLFEASIQLPQCNFVMVGPEAKTFNKLHQRENIHFVGRQPYERLPGFIKGFDVCLIPYKLNEFVRNISPLKLYEYMASGKPIVGPNIRALENLRDHVYVARDIPEMIAMIKTALSENDEKSRIGRIRQAKQNTWRQRVETISAKIIELEQTDLS